MITITEGLMIAALWTVQIAVFLLWPAKWDPAIWCAERRERRHRESWERLRLEIDLGTHDMTIKNGKTTCIHCGSYCGQCSNGDRLDLTPEEYRERFMK